MRIHEVLENQQQQQQQDANQRFQQEVEPIKRFAEQVIAYIKQNPNKRKDVLRLFVNAHRSAKKKQGQPQKQQKQQPQQGQQNAPQGNPQPAAA